MVTSGDDLEPLLDHLKTQRGFDFTGYKRSSLARRIAKRMEEVGSPEPEHYLDYLELHQEEFAYLFNTILINVTAFFRDPEAWSQLTDTVVPRLLATVASDAPIRVWCAGCSSGEETYTVAMVLAEALGEEAYLKRVKIYATDVDDEALDAARAAAYTPKQVEGVPPELLEKYFDRSESRFAFRKDLRRAVIFGRNDLVQDAPISRVDLLVCRNTLMYFNAETQGRILRRFHFALNPHGFLFVGKSEMLITHGDLFAPDDLKSRIFAKVAKPSLHDRLFEAGGAPAASRDGAPPEAGSDALHGAFDAGPNAQFVIDRTGVLQLVNAEARSLLGITADQVGRPLKDLEASYKPVELRSHLDRTWASGAPVTVDGIQFGTDGDRKILNLSIIPLEGPDGPASGAAVMFSDVTTQADLEARLLHAKHELEASYEELQSTVEELETTNEELQSTNEELETTNEELQSTNEELETMNEELQSTNEELETINEELRERSHELDDVNVFLETILASLGLAVVVVDRQLCVRIWNDGSTELWGLRSEEAVGEHLLGLDIGLPVEGLKKTLLRSMEPGAERAEVTLEATNRRGKTVTCQVTVVGLMRGETVTGAILLMRTEPAG
jgi:two-component system CheB/CheR fusion protein